MSRESAIAAYRQSAYQKIEYDIDTSVGKATFPVIGGLRGEIQIVFNRLLLPFKMLSGYLFGGDFPVDNIKPAKIPPELAGTQYGQALNKLRENGREVADMRAESWNHFLNLDFTSGFRMRRAANYSAYQNRHVVLPDEGMGMIDVAATIGAAKLTRDAMVQRLSDASSLGKNEDSLGRLSSASAFKPPATANMLTQLVGLFTKH